MKESSLATKVGRITAVVATILIACFLMVTEEPNNDELKGLVLVSLFNGIGVGITAGIIMWFIRVNNDRKKAKAANSNQQT